MRLEMKASRVTKCTYENHMGPNMNANLTISSKSHINVPGEFKKGSVGTIITKLMIGSPMQPLYIYIEQITTFMDDEADENTCESRETMMSLFKTICVPLAHEEIERTITELCKVYNIPEIKMKKNAKPEGNNNSYLN